MQFDRAGSSSVLVLDQVGLVILTLDSSTLSWKLVKGVENELNSSSCLGFASKAGNWINFSDVYAVEFINWGLIHEPILPNAGGCFLGRDLEMYRFVVHGCQKSKMRHNPCILAAFTFGHKDLKTCQMWVEQINERINMEAGRPKSLLVFVHPQSGKGNGCRTWETVSPIFSCAKVRTKVIVTQRAGHAFDVMKSITDKELNSYDGVVTVGGDGFFNEVLNGLLSSRHEAPYPPAPTEFMQSIGFDYHAQRTIHFKGDEGGSAHGPNDSARDIPGHNEASDPLLESSESILSDLSNFRTEIGPCDKDESPVVSFPNGRLRLGIIPAGSTDAIVISTTGARDPVTSALQIVLGKRRCLDIAQVVQWKATISSTDPPTIRYAASFAGYGFYGDVIRESEKYRWMGPKRYDFAGTKVFMKHKSYEAEVSFLKVKPEDPPVKEASQDTRIRRIWSLLENPKKLACRVDCPVCEETGRPGGVLSNDTEAESQDLLEDLKWLRLKGCFLSVGAAIISCRNERAPDGLVADAHLSDGLMDLILVKDCPRAFYLWHLTQLTRRGSNPLNFEFVEHHKTTAFTFTSSSDESVWNLDGEPLQACQLSAQVFRGLVTLFASGPEV